jgi:hypothetical protein
MEVFEYVAIVLIFLAVFVPLVALGIDVSREMKRLDQEQKSK